MKCLQASWQRGGNRVAHSRLMYADTYWLRLRGLLARPAPGAAEALCIEPCSSVHMFFMRYALDIVYLDRAGAIIKIASHLQPWRLSQCWGAHRVLEFRAGEVASLGLQVGDVCVDGG
ncbi:DUF192 domain-containing protein [Gilvimarinus sp. DA14]|uniref:DUF192 domain-containing protein n=1 Tax=Gilvimarinus sp. DA14 TaxID=2956798 RepID=UPI0020B72CB4|nr:DUF192 domain-containing protein [Gilvimarinus sp. DA14]UTF59447.1 DUF192 domain-containing protein [Gilvimarinus sp. DA14]